MKKIAVILPTFNRVKYLKKILIQLENQILPVNILLSIIVVVDGSNDGTYEMLKGEFQNVQVLEGDGNWWWTKCINEAIKVAELKNIDFVLLMNDDNEVKQDFISSLLYDYEKVPCGSILGSATVSISEPNLIEMSGSKSFNSLLLKFKSYHCSLSLVTKEFEGVHPTFNLNGRGSLIPLTIFKKTGYLDEKLVQYGSDDEFALRAVKKGIPVYISWNSRVYNHTILTSQGASIRKDKLPKFLRSFMNPYSVNSFKKSMYFYKKHGVALFLPFYLLYVFIGTCKAYFFKY